MIELLFLSTAMTSEPVSPNAFPCEGIRTIESSISDRPRPFASLREQSKEMTTVRDANGRRVQREVSVTTVKALAGFTNCTFIYSTQIDLACYIGNTLGETETVAIAAKLISTAESVGHCLTNRSGPCVNWVAWP